MIFFDKKQKLYYYYFFVVVVALVIIFLLNPKFDILDKIVFYFLIQFLNVNMGSENNI